MKNYGIQRFKNANVDNFTSDKGIEIRRKKEKKKKNMILKTICIIIGINRELLGN